MARTRIFIPWLLTCLAVCVTLAVPTAPAAPQPLPRTADTVTGGAKTGAPLSLAQSAEAVGAATWHRAGLTGQGVRVGVLDIGFAGYRDFLGTELPAEVTAESFVPGQAPGGGTQSHGTACAKIVHAIAPGASLYLASYDGSESSMAQAVRWLVDRGVRVISHSATFTFGAMDGTGAQSDLVAYAASRGVLWVNAMGNYGQSHYRGAYLDSDADGWHEFPNGEEAMAVRPTGGATLLSLTWDDSRNAARNFDLFLLDADRNVISASEGAQDGTAGDLAYEAISLAGASPGALYYVAVHGPAAAGPILLDVYAAGGEVGFATARSSLGTPADSPFSLSVGAADWQGGQIEAYSSQGPTGDGRVKPDMVGPDGIDVGSPAQGPFYGTSASAPCVAGAAALVLGAHPGYTRLQVTRALTAAARDLGDPGPDNVYGYGALRLPAP